MAEGCGLRVNWSFFESCHGKCYCDPEGGVLKNAARHHELTVTDRYHQLKDSEAVYVWASSVSGLGTPKNSLLQKKGRGIYRRFFYWIPSKGIGAVNRGNLPKLKAEGTSRLHEFLDIGVVGTVSTRRAACHRCDKCWDFERNSCANACYVGQPVELPVIRENVPTTATERINRATINREGSARARNAVVGSVVCVETHKDEQMHPWIIGRVLEGIHDATSASPPFSPTGEVPIQFEPLRACEPALKIQLFEALDVGSTTYFISEVKVQIPARSVRVIDVQLEEARASARVQVVGSCHLAKTSIVTRTKYSTRC